MKSKFFQNYMKQFDDMPKAFRKSKYIFVYLMVSLAIVNFIVFYVVVNLNSILLAFQEFIGYDENYVEQYVWSLGNFKSMFKEFALPNSTVGIAVRNTLKYFATNIFLMIPVSYFVSYLLFKQIRGYGVFRVVFFLPSIISAVVYVTVFKNIISTFGPLYMLLDKVFGYQMPPLLGDSRTAPPTIIIYTIWTGLGINMILYQGAMKRIPTEVLEACQIDGGNKFHELFYIITPMVWPTVSMTIILAFTGLFNSSGPILLFSEAGTVAGGNDTTTIAFFIFQKTQTGAALEYPAAIGIFFTAVSIPIVIAVRAIFKRLDPEVEY